MLNMLHVIKILKGAELCKRESRRPHQANTRRSDFRCCVIWLNHLMKNRVSLCLCAVLGASFISVRAADTPIQAAARVALQQKLNELDHPQALPAPVPAKSIATVMEQPAKATANATGAICEKSVTPQTIPVPAMLATASAAVVPVAGTPAVAASIALAPDFLLLVLLLLIISFLMLSFQLLKFLRQNSPGYDADQTSTTSRG